MLEGRMGAAAWTGSWGEEVPTDRGTYDWTQIQMEVDDLPDQICEKEHEPYRVRYAAV